MNIPPYLIMLIVGCIAAAFIIEPMVSRIDFPGRFAAFQLWLIERQWRREAARRYNAKE